MSAPQHLRPYDCVLDTIGWTPLIRLARVGAGIRTPVYGKAEYANPGGSVKDRIAMAMIEAAERAGDLKPGGTIVEGTSGNTGVGLAIAAALKGYRCIFTLPDKMSQEKVRLLKAYGAEVVIVPTAVPPDHPEYYIMKAKQIVKDTPGAIFANQHFNPANPEAHYRTTGPEIWAQTDGRVTHFVASAGTGGTVSGGGKFLKEKNPGIKVIAGDPVRPTRSKASAGTKSLRPFSGSTSTTSARSRTGNPSPWPAAWPVRRAFSSVAPQASTSPWPCRSPGRWMTLMPAS
jgi:cystathionine beta-synthase